MTDNPFPNPGGERHRRSDRHTQPPRVVRADNAYRAEKAPPSRAKARTGAQLSPVRIAVLAALIILTVLAAFRYADSALRAQEERDRIQAERDAYQTQINRHTPRYTSSIQHWSDEYGIDPALIKAVIYRESHYDPSAISSAGARGLMQLMPDTGTWMAQKAGISNYTEDSLFDPDLNIRLGTRYLHYLSGLFEGDPVLVVCAYHAGAGNVRTWVQNHSTDGTHLAISQIPMSDTRTYAERVMQSYAIYLENP